MSVKENKQVVQRAVDALNSSNWSEAVAEFAATPADAEAFLEIHSAFRHAFPDYHFTVEDMIAEGDKVAVRGMVRATHKEEFPFVELKGIAPTGNQLEWREIWIWQISDGRIVNSWEINDGVSRLQQLGVLPPPE